MSAVILRVLYHEKGECKFNLKIEIWLYWKNMERKRTVSKIMLKLVTQKTKSHL